MSTPNFDKQEPLLSFEFATSAGVVEPFTFKNPLKIISTSSIEEVLSCMEQVQIAVNHGYYAAGFLTYESAAAFDPAMKVKPGHAMPLVWFGIFTGPEKLELTSAGTYTLSDWKPSVGKEEYHTSIQYIKAAIESGDTYQTNYTIRLHSQFSGDELAFFTKLKKAQASNYCAYIHTGDHSILSASPELFFHLEGDNITTRPMKGTVKRGNTLAEDEENASWLYRSEKNRAENVMIVDLLRNDLNIVSEPGTVHVPKLYEIEHYPTVHQMTSTIAAKISAETSLVDIFKALFPCGSITGAPKLSTMKIITELESEPREIYCGAIGFITPTREAIFNVPIRTVVIEKKTGKATYGVGGGITWDSTAEGEYDEILVKASLLGEDRPEFQLLESFLLNKGEYFLLEEHLGRLARSAKYFGFAYQERDARNKLTQFAKEHGNSSVKVRFLLSKNGDITIESQPAGQLGSPIKAILAEVPVNKHTPFLYHKTTHRDIYSPFQQKKPADVFDVLLWNEDGELTEFTNGNVVLEVDGQFYTPPISSGLLAGTFREKLLKDGDIQEKTLTVADLSKCTRIWFINSVRKWLEVELINI
ncbi:aminodeoxychorismate synthase component I [Neobacillus sp. LXY-4]|uniref:aminodeoxychorismate synthase component I n=1 Tax=Neobacillus sp. LXY-4 TaxID=3379826 RepID=UPI003EE36E08